jgi:hypothetical protein
VLSVLETVHPSALLSITGELIAVEHGGAAVSSPKSGDQPLSPFPHLLLAVHHLINGQKSSIPLRGLFLLKKPLAFIYLNPPSLAYSRSARSFFGKRSFFGIYEKYIFRLITELPLQ